MLMIQCNQYRMLCTQYSKYVSNSLVAFWRHHHTKDPMTLACAACRTWTRESDPQAGIWPFQGLPAGSPPGLTVADHGDDDDSGCSSMSENMSDQFCYFQGSRTTIDGVKCGNLDLWCRREKKEEAKELPFVTWEPPRRG